MAHAVLGEVSASTYNTTQDKTIPITVAVPAGSILVAISMGYGSDGTIDLSSISDSKSHTWDTVKRSAATPSRFAMMSWTRITNPLTTSDTVTIDMTGTFTRSWAILRAYAGLGDQEMDTDSAVGTNSPAATPALTHSGDGRAIAAVFWPSEDLALDYWENSFVRSSYLNDAGNVDAFVVGERVVTGAGTVTPSHNPPGVTSLWVMVGITLPDAPTRRPSPAMAG
jgi:hypothetical protein